MIMYHVKWYSSSMDATDVEINTFIELLMDHDAIATGTSVRIPDNLRRAGAIATEMGFATSMTDLAVSGLRGVLEGIAMTLVLEQHFQEHPHLRPSLAQEAVGLAELDGNPLVTHIDLIEEASASLIETNPAATADDVLVYAAALLSRAPVSA